jgi:hypothetical protein
MPNRAKKNKKKARPKAGSDTSPEWGSLAADAKVLDPTPSPEQGSVATVVETSLPLLAPVEPEAPASPEEKKGVEKRKKKVDPYLPSTEAVKVLANIVGSLEALNLQDRGHVVARLKELYLSPAKSGKGKSKKNSSSAKQKKPQASKAPWKVLWHRTPEYRAWQDAIKSDTKVGDAHFSSLLEAAIRQRDALRTRFQSPPGGNPGTTVLAPPLSTSGGPGQETAQSAGLTELVFDE